MNALFQVCLHTERGTGLLHGQTCAGGFFLGGGMLACRAGILPFLSFSPQESELLKPSEVLYFEKSGDEVGTCVRVG